MEAAMKNLARMAAFFCGTILAAPGLSLAQPSETPTMPPAVNSPAVNPNVPVPPERMGGTAHMKCASEMTPAQCMHPETPGPPPETRPPSQEKPKKPHHRPPAPPPA
jgi:hypothetical protein